MVKKDKSTKGKDNVKGGKVNPPEEFHAEIHAEQSDSEETQKNPVETQAEEEADEDVDEDFPSRKRRKEKVNLDEEQEEDLLNWYKDNEMFIYIYSLIYIYMYNLCLHCKFLHSLFINTHCYIGIAKSLNKIIFVVPFQTNMALVDK